MISRVLFDYGKWQQEPQWSRHSYYPLDKTIAYDTWNAGSGVGCSCGQCWGTRVSCSSPLLHADHQPGWQLLPLAAAHGIPTTCLCVQCCTSGWQAFMGLRMLRVKCLLIGPWIAHQPACIVYRLEKGMSEYSPLEREKYVVCWRCSSVVSSLGEDWAGKVASFVRLIWGNHDRTQIWCHRGNGEGLQRRVFKQNSCIW